MFINYNLFYSRSDVCSIYNEKMIKYFPLGVFSFMTLAHTHATNTEFTRIENGILDDLYVHSQQSVLLNSLASCSAHCSQSVGCKSYTWKNATSSCVLLSTDITRNLLDPSIPQDIAVYTKCKFSLEIMSKSISNLVNTFILSIHFIHS